VRFQDLWNFVKAVGRHWAPVLTGGGIAIAVYFYDHLAGNSKWVFWLSIALSLFTAVFRAWRDERHKSEMEIGKLKQQREADVAELNQQFALSEPVNRVLGAGHFLKGQFLDSTMTQCDDQTRKQILAHWAQEIEGTIYRHFGEDASARFSSLAREIPDSAREQENWIQEQNRKLYQLTQRIHHTLSKGA
jgi:hypothetical protein